MLMKKLNVKNVGKNISIIGLGKLGACMLAAYASKGYRAIGVDINRNYIDAINKGGAPVEETGLKKYLSENIDRISATQDYSEATKNSEITFIIVPTPTDETGGFSVKYVLSVCAEIGKALQQKNSYHLIVLTSTVLPMDCESTIIPEIEKHSNKKCGVDFGFCYSPEFIAIGSVIRDLLNPDFFLIGEFDKKSGDTLEAFYSTISINSAKVKKMNIPSAELTKISLNHFLTTKITFANMLAEIAGKIPSVNIDVITDALGSDTRIGSKYLKGGLGYGGPCFPRDNRAFASVAEKRGVHAPFAKSTDDYNNSIIERMARLILKQAVSSSKIGILGLSYKPETGFCEESQGLNIAKKLSQLQYQVNVFETNGFSHAKTLLGESVHYKNDLDDFLDDSDIIFLTNWDKNNQILKNKKIQHKLIIIDPWRQFSVDDFSEPVIYMPLGIGNTNTQ